MHSFVEILKINITERTGVFHTKFQLNRTSNNSFMLEELAKQNSSVTSFALHLQHVIL